VQLYHGGKHGVINFADDLMRLIYYDQESEIRQIYKDSASPNYVSDSREFRKAIFEVLMGQTFDKYYEAFADMKAKEDEMSSLGVQLQQYRQFAASIRGKAADMNLPHLIKENKGHKMHCSACRACVSSLFDLALARVRLLMQLTNKK